MTSEKPKIPREFTIDVIDDTRSSPLAVPPSGRSPPGIAPGKRGGIAPGSPKRKRGTGHPAGGQVRNVRGMLKSQNARFPLFSRESPRDAQNAQKSSIHHHCAKAVAEVVRLRWANTCLPLAPSGQGRSTRNRRVGRALRGPGRAPRGPPGGLASPFCGLW